MPYAFPLMPWRYRTVPWTCRGGTVEVPWRYRTAPPRHLHGTSMVPPWPAWGRKCTNATAMAQTCHGDAVRYLHGTNLLSHCSRYGHGTPTASARRSQPPQKSIPGILFFSEAQPIFDPLRLFGDAHGTSTAPPRYLHGTSAVWSRLWTKICQKGAAIPWRYRRGGRRAMGEPHKQNTVLGKVS